MTEFNLTQKETCEQIKSLTLKENLEIFEKMCFIRAFEQNLMKPYDEGLVRGPMSLSIGQEAPASTISTFFKPDLIFTQHRANSYYFCYGGNLKMLIDEVLGRDSGCTHGQAGMCGAQDLSIGMIGHHGLIGQNVPLAVGAALGDPSKKVLCVFGDGAAEEDYIFPSMAFAFMHKLPILFICEDNDLAILTRKSVRRNWELSDAIKGIGMPAVNIPDTPELIAHYIKKFAGNLPAFINCRTCRHKRHMGSKSDGEPEICRLSIFRQMLLDKGVKEGVLVDIEDKAKKEMNELWKEQLLKQ